MFHIQPVGNTSVMTKITSSIKTENYKVVISSESGNELIADEPIDNGGQNLGFSPKELLASSLAACTSATVRMYANRKGWDLQEIKIEIELEYNAEEVNTTINRKISFIGNLDHVQRARLLAVANACPVHKILSNPIKIHTILNQL